MPADLGVTRYQLQLVSVSSSTDIFSGIARFSVSQDLIPNLRRKCQRQTAGSSGRRLSMTWGWRGNFLQFGTILLLRRRREGQMRRFKSAKRAQDFFSAHAFIHGRFRPRRPRLTASVYRAARNEAFNIWQQNNRARRPQ
jgi:hypothetical protein